MKLILEINEISKKFRIHHEHQPYLSLRDSIASVFRNRSKNEDEDFWALKNVSFTVEQGESIGIIGKNGAGKSTLLKILSKITPPTSGKIISRGRIASLLEVGTGFHGELSGRENIFLNGAILGMKRKEIERKFDEIVDFSGVEKFIDTPIKHYSSGMQLRLAFAVAAFLEPEILIIDEVLAVGDAEFQKKCMGKMDEVSKSGRTVLFVSHNLSQMQSFCPKCILLDGGELILMSDADEVISRYMESTINIIETDLANFSRVGYKHESFSFKKININNANKIYENEALEVELTFFCKESIEGLMIGVSVKDMFNNNLIECRSGNNPPIAHDIGDNKIRLCFNPRLKAGVYNIHIGAKSPKSSLDYIPNVARIHILNKENNNGALNESVRHSNGIIITPAEWKMM